MVLSRLRATLNGISGAARHGDYETHRQRSWWDAAESIDYMPINNDVMLSLRHCHRRHVYGFSGRTFAAVVSTVFVGLIIGVTARFVELGIKLGTYYRNWMFADIATDSGLALALVALGFISIAILVFTATCVQLVAPGASGSGVSLVMAFLNGNNLHGLLTPAVYVVKFLGTIASRTAGLALGPEAPLVHIGACVASLVFGLERRWMEMRQIKSKEPEVEIENGVERYRSKFDPMLRVFSNSSHRQIVSAGAAAGMAAAFGAPIGGVLFSLEEACSVWSRKTAWRCLLCSAVAVFTMSQLNPELQGGLLALRGVYPLSSRQWLKQLPFVTIVSIGGGLLGALFNLLRRGIQYLRASSRKHMLRTIEAGVVAALTISIIAGSSLLAGRCLDLPPSWSSENVLQFNCPVNQYNDLATAFLSSGPWVIRALLALGSETEPLNMPLLMSSAAVSKDICSSAISCYFSLRALAVLCIVYLLLMVLSSGLAVPGGLFMPCIMVGSSFGALLGLLLAMILPASWDIQPGVYALVGSAAALCAVFRSNISLVVILVEGTSGISFLPGILAAVIVSNYIAHYIHPDGVYEGELERDGRVVFLRQEPPSALRWKTAAQIGSNHVTTLKQIESVDKILEVLKKTTYNGFPVLSCHENNGSGSWPVNPISNVNTRESSGTFEGFILRSQLLVLLQHQAFCDENGNYVDTPTDVLAFEAHLEGLMQAAKISSDGLGGQIEQKLDPLANKEQGESIGLGASPAMMQTVETMRILGSLPDFEAAFADLYPSSSDTDGIYSKLHNGIRFQLPHVYLNLAPFMDKGIITVRPETPAVTVHRLFVALSLRHLCITDKLCQITGIITRRDLDIASGTGWWRVARMPASQRDVGDLLHSQSWIASSIQNLIQIPTRTVSDMVQRLSSLSPLNQARLLGSTEDEENHEPLL